MSARISARISPLLSLICVICLLLLYQSLSLHSCKVLLHSDYEFFRTQHCVHWYARTRCFDIYDMSTELKASCFPHATSVEYQNPIDFIEWTEPQVIWKGEKLSELVTLPKNNSLIELWYKQYDGTVVIREFGYEPLRYYQLKLCVLFLGSLGVWMSICFCSIKFTPDSPVCLRKKIEDSTDNEGVYRKI